jgi:hypothetical protein
MKQHLTESVIGLVIAALLLWVAIASNTDVPFIYGGL